MSGNKNHRQSVKDIESSKHPHFMAYLCLGQCVFRGQFTAVAL